MTYNGRMETLLWILLSLATTSCSSALVYFVIRSRMQNALAREREALAETRGMLEAQRKSINEALKGAEESGRHKAMEEFLADVRIEQRHYIRQAKMLFLQRRSLVLQERIFFRNVPLSNWIEHEILLEEGADIESVVRSLTAFDNALPQPARRRLLH